MPGQIQQPLMRRRMCRNNRIANHRQPTCALPLQTRQSHEPMMLREITRHGRQKRMRKTADSIQSTACQNDHRADGGSKRAMVQAKKRYRMSRARIQRIREHSRRRRGCASRGGHGIRGARITVPLKRSMQQTAACSHGAGRLKTPRFERVIC
jgi:hypothetical protein